jgi:two-component system CheB/CheR fusion protein
MKKKYQSTRRSKTRKTVPARELWQANLNLERMNAEMKQLAYIASHDLQEPLRKIITFSDLLKKNTGTQLDAKAKEQVEKIVESSLRMKQLVEDFMRYVNTEVSEKKFKPTDLNFILKDVLQDFDSVMTNSNAQVNGNHLPEISAVPVQMKQLFHNLISNSVKFKKKSVPPVINIDSRILPSKELGKYLKLRNNADYVEITFRDNGIGFGKKFSEQIFAIFQRLHEKEKYDGTGIGLALCRKIVHNHDGEIFAESSEGKGATFRIILPVTH